MLVMDPDIEETETPEVTEDVVIHRRLVKTALHQAILDRRLHQVRLLVEKHGDNVDSRDVCGRTPLMLACLLEDDIQGYKIVCLLMKAGAYLNIRDKLDRTALHYACMKGREACVRKFLKDDTIEVNVRDVDGNTPLMHAALSGNPHITELILKQLTHVGLSIDDRNALGYTPLLLACKYGHYVTAHILLTRGRAEPTLRDNEFFFNAKEWLIKSRSLQASFISHRSHTAPVLPLLSRESTLYDPDWAPTCCHSGNTPHPLGQSLDSALKLPAVFSYFQLGTPAEQLLDGADARTILLKEIQGALLHHSQQGKLGKKSRTVPSTAKLRSLSNGNHHSAMVPDMRKLFKLYSDQYQPKRESKRYSQGSWLTSLPSIKVQTATPMCSKAPSLHKRTV